MRRTLLTLLLVLLPATPAAASWTAGGTGTGTAATANMPTGATPTVAVATRSVTVTWAQNTFAGGTIGARGGSYTITRYAEGSSTPFAPGTGCDGPRSGSTNPQTCTETNVPYGRWVYRVTPILNTFTGTQDPSSAVAAVVLPAPVLQSVTAQNPAAGTTDGPIALSWAASTGATGYNVYRRVSGGSYDFTTPLNGATALTGTTLSDTTATQSRTYDYVVRAINSPPLTTSVDSNQLSAKVITRPPAPAGAVSAVRGTGGAINVTWSTVSAAQGYNVYRRTATGAFDYTQPLNGATLVTGTTFRDTAPATGTNYVYVIRSVITGADGAKVESVDSALSSQTSCASDYSATITASGPTDDFRLGETSGSVAVNDRSTGREGVYGGGVSYGQTGAITCDANTTVLFDGTTGYVGAGPAVAAVAGPDTFSIEVWFKTTSAAGGKLVGFGNAKTGQSSQYDRHIYLTNSGQVVFGVYPGAARSVTSPASYNDGNWHMAVAVLGPSGQRLYVDGAQVGVDTGTTTGQGYSGYWRAGYDSLNGWPATPSSLFFGGRLDEIAIYGTQLTGTAVAAHYAAGRP